MSVMSRLGVGMQGQDRNPRCLPEAPAVCGVSVAWAGAEGSPVVAKGDGGVEEACRHG